MATTPVTPAPAPAPAPKPEDVITPEKRKEMQDQINEQRRMAAEDKAYNKADMTPDKPPKKMAKGGMASSRADGIAQRGKTRGKMC